MSTITIHNAETNEIIEREMDAKELAQFNKQQAQAQLEDEIQEKAKAEADIAKAAATAKLAALGLTTDDLKALGLGGN